MQNNNILMTIEYYNQHAKSFIESTLNVDMSQLYHPFISRLPKHALILDAGCGSGRDSKAFVEMGYQVEAIDASAEMVAYTSNISGVLATQKTFQEINESNRYDAIWACASLLHVPKNELLEVLNKLTRALKDNGIWYLSFKYGEQERTKDGRTFTDMTEHTLQHLLSQIPQLHILDLWQTQDARPERAEKWLNVIVKKSAK